MIQVTKNTRSIIIELCQLHKEFDIATAALTLQGISDNEAMRVAYDRRIITIKILGCANRLVKSVKR